MSDRTDAIYDSTMLVVPKVGFEPTRPYGHYALNVARLPFRHFGTPPTEGLRTLPPVCVLFWWAIQDLNL